MEAMQADSFLANAICRNSFGPWALECGPNTPVTTNWVLGNFAPSMAMKGIEPPSPIKPTGLPNASVLAFSNALASQGDRLGAFQPLSAGGPSKLTSA